MHLLPNRLLAPCHFANFSSVLFSQCISLPRANVHTPTVLQHTAVFAFCIVGNPFDSGSNFNSARKWLHPLTFGEMSMFPTSHTLDSTHE